MLVFDQTTCKMPHEYDNERIEVLVKIHKEALKLLSI